MGPDTDSMFVSGARDGDLGAFALLVERRSDLVLASVVTVHRGR